MHIMLAPDAPFHVFGSGSNTERLDSDGEQ